MCLVILAWTWGKVVFRVPFLCVSLLTFCYDSIGLLWPWQEGAKIKYLPPLLSFGVAPSLSNRPPNLFLENPSRGKKGKLSHLIIHRLVSKTPLGFIIQILSAKVNFAKTQFLPPPPPPSASPFSVSPCIKPFLFSIVTLEDHFHVVCFFEWLFFNGYLYSNAWWLKGKGTSHPPMQKSNGMLS